MSGVNYPLQLSFQIIAVAPQIRIIDASGAQILYVRQKILKFKEHVEVYTDDTKAEKLCDINADRVIDWSAVYRFTTPAGASFGAVRRKGARSLWRAHYEVFEDDVGDTPDFVIREEKASVKVMDGIFGGIPVIGGLAGYVFNPTYLVSKPDGSQVLRARKQPALWEGKFTIEKTGDLSDGEAVRTLVALLMMLLLERRRG